MLGLLECTMRRLSLPLGPPLEDSWPFSRCCPWPWMTAWRWRGPGAVGAGAGWARPNAWRSPCPDAWCPRCGPWRRGSGDGSEHGLGGVLGPDGTLWASVKIGIACVGWRTGAWPRLLWGSGAVGGRNRCGPAAVAPGRGRPCGDEQARCGPGQGQGRT